MYKGSHTVVPKVGVVELEHRDGHVSPLARAAPLAAHAVLAAAHVVADGLGDGAVHVVAAGRAAEEVD